MMNSKKILGILSLVIFFASVYSVVLPGDLRIYIGLDTQYTNILYACVNVKNPTYATDIEKFSPENICYFIYKAQIYHGVEYQTTTVGRQEFQLFRWGDVIYFPIASFEYRAGAQYLKIFMYSNNFTYAPNIKVGYYEPYFIETLPTGYIKILFDQPGTYRIRYIAVDKAIGPEPFIFYGPILSKEEVLNEPPYVEIFEPVPGTLLLEKNTVTLRFRATDPENRTMTCYIYVGGKEYTYSVISGENVTIALTIDYLGNVTISVTCRDPFGLTGSAKTYVLRESPPSVAIVDIANRELYIDNTPLVASTTMVVSYYAADNGPELYCVMRVIGTNVTHYFNITLPEGGILYNQTTVYLTGMTAGRYTLEFTCNDTVGLNRTSVMDFYYALDPDDLMEWCTEIGGEWYGHCCGDDAGEAVSTQAKGWPTPQAFDPATCSIIDLQPGQCDDAGDCPPSGWFCTNTTFRELRYYTCSKQPGQLIGTCQESILQYENCTVYGPDYFCSDGNCTTVPYQNQPPTITIYEPQQGATLKIPSLKNYITVRFRVDDDTSTAVACNMTLNDYIRVLGVLNVSQTYEVNITGIVNGTNTLSITCIDANNLTTTESVTFSVQIVPAECVVDTDCGVDSWQCISPTERAYIDYICLEGQCVANITQTQTAPAGYICIEGQFVNETTLSCSTDADCPPDDRVCLQDRSGYVIRDWYCDTTAGVCRYNITQTIYCGQGAYCLAGTCWPFNETACEGLITTFCTSNTTYMQLVAIYEEDLGTCVYKIVGEFNCPAGTVCFSGKCSVSPTVNLPPVIEYNVTKKRAKPGEAVPIKIKVTDDNTPALFVNVTAQIPEIIQVFKGVVYAGKEVTVYYVPPHASVHVITISAIDQYGVLTTEQTTIEVEEVVAPAPAPAPAAAAPPAAAPAAPVGIPPAPPKIPIEIIMILVAVVGAGAVIYYIYRLRA